MLQNIADLRFLLPEIIILITACSLLCGAKKIGENNRYGDKYSKLFLWFTVCALGLAIFTIWFFGMINMQISEFPEIELTYRTQSMKIICLGLVLVGFIYNEAYIVKHHMRSAEYYALSLFMLLGVMTLISAGSLLTLYLGLELIALPFYALVALDKDGLGSEAAMKYFILGSLASGLLLYGMSLIFGATGQLELAQMALMIPSQANTELLALGWIFIFVGLAFKLGAVPFHAWLPDVYQGASTPIALFLSGAPKIAVLVVLLKCNVLFSAITPYWELILRLVAVASVVVGTIFAIAQTNLKRLLGYSVIANLGFILCALLDNSSTGEQAALYYMVIYAFTVTGCFGIINKLNIENISDLTGLHKFSPFLAMCMAIYMFSFTGLPPLAGFYAKFLVLKELLNGNNLIFAVFLLILSVIAAIYYLNIIKVMYFDNNNEGIKQQYEVSLDIKLLVSLNVLIILFLGIFPSYLIEIIQ